MHHVDLAKHLRDMSGFLGGYYLIMAVMNATVALRVRPLDLGPCVDAGGV